MKIKLRTSKYLLKVFKNIASKIEIIILCILYYVLGNFRFHNYFKLDYTLSSVSPGDIKSTVEFLYYLLACLLIPLAYFQYNHEKRKDKKGSVQYTHQLYKIYSETILLDDCKYTPEKLSSLSLGSDKDEIMEFNHLLNKTDTFAAAFNYGIADLDTGKKMMGNTYCQQILSYIPAIKRISGDNYRDGLENLFDLYDKWSQ